MSKTFTDEDVAAMQDEMSVIEELTFPFRLLTAWLRMKRSQRRVLMFDARRKRVNEKFERHMDRLRKVKP